MVPENQIIFRLRAAIREKHRKYLRYLETGEVNENEPYIIAINGDLIPYNMADSGDQCSFIVKSVYPIGSHAIVFDSAFQEVSSGFAYRPEIKKANGSTVDTTVFQDETFSGVSAIIYSCANVADGHRELGDEFQFLHNPTAANPVPRGWLQKGREIWRESDQLYFKDW